MRMQNVSHGETEPGRSGNVVPDGSKKENSGIWRKLWHHWLSGNRTGFHLALGCVCAGIYALAGLIGSSVENFVWKEPMQIVGFAGLFVTLLLVLLHANLHGSNRFLQMFEDTGHLPVRQMTAVCTFCMILFLAVSAVVMGGCSAVLPMLWRAFCRWLEGRRVYVDPEAAANIVPDMDNRTPELAAIAGEVRETPFWVRAVEQLIFLAGYVMIVVIVIFLFWQLARALYRRFSRPVQWDDDVRISLKPDGDDAEPEKAAAERTWMRRLRQRMAASRDPREQVREQYRRAVRGGVKRQKAKIDPACLRSAAPEELERIADIADQGLHDGYEKARYDGRF
jgi:succinate dehydrogenase hydrophobic anchor subunit